MIREELKKHNINLSNEDLTLLDKFYNMLIEENKITNLTRITSKEDVYFLHFYDSLMASLAINNPKAKLLDVGSGPGFPGLPLKIYLKDLELHVVEATNKKILFQEKVVNELGLNNVTFNHLRAEDYTKFNYFDYVTTRAVSTIKEQLTYTIPFLKINGSLIALKGKNKLDLELEEVKSLLNKIGAKVDNIIDYNVLDRSYALVIIKKIKETPKGFPKPISRGK